MKKEQSMPMAVILAGGYGSRLYPLTASCPKPLLPVNNRPLLFRILEDLERNQVRNVLILTGYLSENIEKALGQRYGRLKLEYLKEEHPLGSAGALKMAEKQLEDRFFVICGDLYGNRNYRDAADFHLEKGGIATIFVQKVQDPRNYGMVLTGQNKRILSFKEKPSFSEVRSDLGSMGIYLFEKSALSFLKEDEKADIAGDLLPLLLKKGEIYAYEDGSFFCDVGNAEAYYFCNMKDAGNRAVIGKNCTIGKNVTLGNSVLLDHVHIGEKSTLACCIVGENTVMEPGCILGKYSVLGKGCHLEKGVYLEERTVLPPGTRVQKEKEKEYSASALPLPLCEFMERGAVHFSESKPSDALLQKLGAVFASCSKKYGAPIAFFYGEDKETASVYEKLLNSTAEKGGEVHCLGEGSLALAGSVAALSSNVLTVFVDRNLFGKWTFYLLDRYGLPLPEQELKVLKTFFYSPLASKGKGSVEYRREEALSSYEKMLDTLSEGAIGYAKIHPMGKRASALYAMDFLKKRKAEFSKEADALQFVLSPDGRRLSLVLKSGKEIDCHHLWALILFEKIRKKESLSYLPYRIPKILFEIALKNGYHPKGYLIFAGAENDCRQGALEMRFFHDGLAALCCLLSLLKNSRKSIEELLSLLPPFSVFEGGISCKTHEELEILLKDTGEGGEGMRTFRHKNGTVLLHPRFEEGLSLMAEASNAEDAYELFLHEKRKRQKLL